MRITIIDYGLGNLLSVEKAFASLGIDARLETAPSALDAADGVVLPGVGAFGDGMAGLRKGGWLEPLRNSVANGKPTLGICLGLHLLFESSAESPGCEGLNLLPGHVRRFEGKQFGPGALKVPHMGWSELKFHKKSPLLEGLGEGAYVYFVHSYYPTPEQADDILLTAEHSFPFCAGVQRGTLYGLQFHPEKSQSLGLKMLVNFAKIVERHRN